MKATRLTTIVCGASVLLLIYTSASAFEIFALGTSATNCRGVDRDKIFTEKLQDILRADGFDTTVINGGIDGDEPRFMIRRLKAATDPNARLVIFEPGLNDRSSQNVEYSEKIFAYLEEIHLPAIYASMPLIQTNEQAKNLAEKHHAHYYGNWGKDVPVDAVHREFDSWPGSGDVKGGHLTAAGCQIVAKNMAPLVEQVLREKDIH